MTQRIWTRTSIDCYNRCYSNDGTFRKGCVNCPDEEFCKIADYSLLNVVNDLINKFGKPEIKEEKQIHNKKMEHKELEERLKAIETVGKELIEMEGEQKLC